METERNPENLSDSWSTIFRDGFGRLGLLLSITSLVLIIVWLTSDDLGGFGLREDVVTASYFNYHPLFMAIAFLLFMTPASSAFESFTCCRRDINKKLHATFQTLALASIIVGLYIIVDCHTVLSIHGLALSTHSIAGYVTIGLVTITYLMGLILYVFKMGGSLRGSLKPLHKRLGFVSLIMGYTSILMGMTEKSSGMVDTALVFAQVIIGVIIGTLLSVSFSVVKFVDKKDVEFKYTPVPDINKEVLDMGSQL